MHRYPQTIPPKYGRKIADALYRLAGCKRFKPNGDLWQRLERQDFMHSFANGCAEYRFQGKLGFGGKFWSYGDDRGWKINCYREDLTPERARIIAATNTYLSRLWAHYLRELTPTRKPG